MRCIFKLMFVGFFLLSIFLCTIKAMQRCDDLTQSADVSSESIQIKYKQIECNLFDVCKELSIDAAQIGILSLVIFALATIVHESGHALTAKALFDMSNPIQIHIGTTTPQTTPLLFSIGNMHFYKTIPWMSGQTQFGTILYNTNQTAFQKKARWGVITAAGGLSAATLLCGLLSAIMGYCAHSDNKGWAEILIKSSSNVFSPFSCILNTKSLSYMQKRFLINAVFVISLSLIYNIFYGCTPAILIGNGDGMRLWRNFFGVTGIPLKIMQAVSMLGMFGSWAYLLKKYYDARRELAQCTKTVPAEG